MKHCHICHAPLAALLPFLWAQRGQVKQAWTVTESFTSPSHRRRGPHESPLNAQGPAATSQLSGRRASWAILAKCEKWNMGHFLMKKKHKTGNTSFFRRVISFKLVTKDSHIAFLLPKSSKLHRIGTRHRTSLAVSWNQRSQFKLHQATLWTFP